MNPNGTIYQHLDFPENIKKKLINSLNELTIISVSDDMQYFCFWFDEYGYYQEKNLFERHIMELKTIPVWKPLDKDNLQKNVIKETKIKSWRYEWAYVKTIRPFNSKKI